MCLAVCRVVCVSLLVSVFVCLLECVFFGDAGTWRHQGDSDNTVVNRNALRQLQFNYDKTIRSCASESTRGYVSVYLPVCDSVYLYVWVCVCE